MRVLGVDPGLTRCGVGVVDGVVSRRPELVDVTVIRTSTGIDHANRLLRIEQGLETLILQHGPDAVAVERVFAQHNRSSVAGTMQAAGIALLVAARHNIPTAVYTPSEVKAAVSGSGRADKSQVTTVVKAILGLDIAPKPADAADALALAICHLWRGGVTNRYAAAVQAHKEMVG